MAREKFHIILIKPTHYDDDGYPIQWMRSVLPSNSLASVYGIARDAIEREVLGSDVDCSITAIDETNTRVQPEKIIRTIKAEQGRGMICFIGVQTNQFPRAVDLARPFLDAGWPVALGGFHVSGCLSMLETLPDDIVEAQQAGISMFAGEAEERRFDEVLLDAYYGRLKPVYNHLENMPDMRNQPLPFLPKEQVERNFDRYSSFDLGRGCPFLCSFCTIINVQGRVSRFRTVDDLEKIVRANAENGVYEYFITDDNLARNKNWEDFFDRLIELREEGIRLRFHIQVDTLCHRIKGFVEKAVAAGVDHIFVGMESINPENLKVVKKGQNKIVEYRDMFLAWKKFPVIITVGYILGFPDDTRESILRDIDIIKRELPIDVMYFTNLTPLPGSEDHKNHLEEGAWLESDMNMYDLNHRVTHHARMSDEEWDAIYKEAWDHYYTYEHMETVLRRTSALGSNMKLSTVTQLTVYREFRRLYGVHPLEGGLIRRKYRRDRRPTMRRESPFIFYPKFVFEQIYVNAAHALTYFRVRRMMRKIWADPKRFEYTDTAITPSSENDLDELDMFSTDAAKKVVDKRKARRRIHLAEDMRLAEQALSAENER